ncbi:hypothetical protein LZ32DRAFT_241160 [Colletotrichum eremochloae]|nr:hypothetical protein LZ32DRAFT_241160 [Colletotrichum eremochloae]
MLAGKIALGIRSCRGSCYVMGCHSLHPPQNCCLGRSKHEFLFHRDIFCSWFSSFASLIGQALFFYHQVSGVIACMNECIVLAGSDVLRSSMSYPGARSATSVYTKGRSRNSSLIRFEQLEGSRHCLGCRVAH